MAAARIRWMIVRSVRLKTGAGPITVNPAVRASAQARRDRPSLGRPNGNVATGYGGVRAVDPSGNSPAASGTSSGALDYRFARGGGVRRRRAPVPRPARQPPSPGGSPFVADREPRLRTAASADRRPGGEASPRRLLDTEDGWWFVDAAARRSIGRVAVGAQIEQRPVVEAPAPARGICSGHAEAIELVEPNAETAGARAALPHLLSVCRRH
jgi:hypothetical protein